MKFLPSMQSVSAITNITYLTFHILFVVKRANRALYKTYEEDIFVVRKTNFELKKKNMNVLN